MIKLVLMDLASFLSFQTLSLQVLVYIKYKNECENSLNYPKECFLRQTLAISSIDIKFPVTSKSGATVLLNTVSKM